MVQLRCQRTEDNSVKAVPVGAEKLVESKWAWWMAGGMLEGEQWEAHLDQKGPAKFTTLLGVQWAEQCAYGCLTSPWNKIAWIQSTVQRLSRHQTVSQFIRRDKHGQLRSCLLFQACSVYLFLAYFWSLFYCVFPENSPPVTWHTHIGPACRNLHPLNNNSRNPHRHTTFLLLPLRAFFKGRPKWQSSILASNCMCWNFYKCEVSHLQ